MLDRIVQDIAVDNGGIPATDAQVEEARLTLQKVTIIIPGAPSSDAGPSGAQRDPSHWMRSNELPGKNLTALGLKPGEFLLTLLDPQPALPIEKTSEALFYIQGLEPGAEGPMLEIYFIGATDFVLHGAATRSIFRKRNGAKIAVTARFHPSEIVKEDIGIVDEIPPTRWYRALCRQLGVTGLHRPPLHHPFGAPEESSTRRSWRSCGAPWKQRASASTGEREAMVMSERLHQAWLPLRRRRCLR